MNILLTGGAGYIGSHASIVFTRAGHNVVILDNFSNSRRSILGRLSKIINSSLLFVEGDIRDTSLVEKILIDHKIDAVVHFAGLKSVSDSICQPILYADNNVQGAISLLKAMNVTNTKNLVFSSSATVYGEPKYFPIDENHPKNVVNPYGRNKLHIEELLSDVATADSSWHIITLRYFNPVGAHETGFIGEDPLGVPNNLMPYIAKVAGGELPCLNIYGDDYPTADGTGVRDYIHIMDLAEGHLAGLEHLHKMTGHHFFNLGTGYGVSVLQMIEAYELVSKRKIKYQVVPRRIGDVASCFANADKAKLILNWSANRTLEDMCQSSWLWQKNKYLYL